MPLFSRCSPRLRAIATDFAYFSPLYAMLCFFTLQRHCCCSYFELFTLSPFMILIAAAADDAACRRHADATPLRYDFRHYFRFAVALLFTLIFFITPC